MSLNPKHIFDEHWGRKHCELNDIIMSKSVKDVKRLAQFVEWKYKTKTNNKPRIGYQNITHLRC